MAPVPRRIHRILGAVLVLPLLLWTGTGLLFLVKPGWSGAYEMLSAFRDEPLAPQDLVPLAAIDGAHPSRAELGTTVLGPVYRMREADGTERLVDARSGATISPLDQELCAQVAADAASRAQASSRYGTISSTRVDGDAVWVTFTGGAAVRVGRSSLSVSQSGSDTALIDALYRVHYLQWTGIAGIDRTLELAAIVGTWALAGLGVWLLRKSRADR